MTFPTPTKKGRKKKKHLVISTIRFKGFKVPLIALKTSVLDPIIFKKCIFCLS